MVKIKIYSRNDVIKAYLSGLGYDADADISRLFAAYKNLNEDEDISKTFDAIIYDKAKKVFHDNLSRVQMIALYKALFIEGKIAEKYGIDALLPNFNKSDDYFRKSAFLVVPHYKMSPIFKQKIEPLSLSRDV